MFLRQVYDEGFAQAAYVVGCPDAGEAVVIDPQRDVDRYTGLAARHGMRIVAAMETHVHADFLSGVRELCARTGAEAILPACEGNDAAPWRAAWPEADGARVTRVRDGDELERAGVRFRVRQTPGHTPEHTAYLATDVSAAHGESMGIFSGDFVFVGDVGRPDLLERAVGEAGAMEPAARALAASMRRFAGLPEHLQVWPGHGAGSACGKALGAVPQTTVGYELRTSEAFGQVARETGGEEAFVASVLAGQPDPPSYFARMKRENVEGPSILGELPRPAAVGTAEIPSGATVLDTRPWESFCAGHLAGSLSVPLDASFGTVAACYVEPAETIVLAAEPRDVEEAVRLLVRTGLDRVVGVITPAEVAATQGLSRLADIDVSRAAERQRAGGVILDVRRTAEWTSGHPAAARHLPHVQLRPRLGEVPRGPELLVMCRSGNRSARATAMLRRAGYDAVNVAGGFLAWEAAGLPVER